MKLIYDYEENILCALTASVVLILGAFNMPIRAAATEAWVQRYKNIGSTASDEAYAIVRDAAGDVVVAGSTTNATLAAPTNGLIEYLDTNAPSGSVFYRTSAP